MRDGRFYLFWASNTCHFLLSKTQLGYVRYKYPNESWQQVAGNTYQIAQQPGQSPTTKYKVTTKLTVSWIRSAAPNDTRSVRSRQYIKRNVSGRIVGGVGSGLSSIPSGYSWWGFNLGRIETRNALNQIIYLNAGSTDADTHNSQGCKQSLTEGVYKNVEDTRIAGSIDPGTRNIQCQARCDSVEIVSIELEEGQTDPTPYTFKVFDCFNNVTFQRTSPQQPQIEIVPCKYIFPEEHYGFPKVNPLSYFKILQSEEDNKKCTSLILNITTINLDITLLKLCSEPCCTLYPKFCWDCYERCPDETKYKCLDTSSNRVCCYDECGKLVGTANPAHETDYC